ncbi:helix-turn-helix domain-containing protein [Streptacidiphilus monticola]
MAVQASGVAQVEQDGRTTELRAGDIGFFETIRPFRTRFPQRFRMKIFALPRDLLGRPEDEVMSLTARALRPDEGLPALLSPFLSELAEESVHATTPAVRQRLAGTVVDLLAATAAEQLDRPVGELPGSRGVLLLQVQRFIRWHLSDPELTPQVIARVHSISVRYLHRLFEAEGTTVSSWIRALRLREVRKDLALSSGGPADLGQLARRWGFSGTAQLGRAFRADHGLSPTEWRRRHRQQEAPWPCPN